jgi:hypothetical protein
MDAKNEERIRELYRDVLRQQISRPEVRREKKEFMAAYFKKETPFLMRPAFFIPALSSVGIVLIAVLLFQRPISEVSEVEPMRQAVEVPVEVPAEEVRREIPPGEGRYPLVEVEEVTSRVGPTMVYNKPYTDAPITIIWVFPGGNSG